MQVPDVVSGADEDLRVFLFAGQMIEVHHQLKVGIVNGRDQLEPLGRRVDDVGFLAAQRLDGHGQALGTSFRRDAFAELDELLKGVFLGKSFGHSPGTAAPKYDDFGAEPGQSREGLLDVGHLLVAIRLRPGHLESRRKKQVRHRNWQPDFLDVRHRFLELFLRQCGNLGCPKLEVVEAAALAASMFFNVEQ